MAKKERLSAFNRENILDAARRLLLEKGIAQTTMDDISKEADYSKSTVYVYFKSKDEIYDYIVLEQFELLKAAVGEVLYQAPGFPEGYFAICAVMTEAYERYPLFFEGILSEVAIPDDDADGVLAKIHKVGEDIDKIIGDYMNGCAAAGQISLDIPPLRAVFIIWSGIAGIIAMAHKKEAYINKALGVTKEIFMQDGFCMLLKSIKGDYDDEN